MLDIHLPLRVGTGGGLYEAPVLSIFARWALGPYKAVKGPEGAMSLWRFRVSRDSEGNPNPKEME